MLRALRSNLVVLIVFALYLVTAVLVMVLIDKVIYQTKKKEIITENPGETLNFSAQEIYNLTLRYSLATSNQVRAETLAELAEVVDREFERANGVWFLRALGPNEEVLVQREAPERFAELNTWDNSLFFRDFSGVARWRAESTDMEVELRYTTPANNEEIEDLTGQFRLIALFVWGVITIIFALLVLTVILPIRRVMSQVSAEGTRLLRRPGSALERGYNAVATQALVAQLSGEISELVQSPAHWTESEFDPALVEAVRTAFEFPAVALVSLEPTTTQPQIRAVAAQDPEPLRAALERSPAAHADFAPGTRPHALPQVGEALRRLVAAAPVLETASSRVILVVTDAGDWTFQPRWHAEMLRAVAAEVRTGLLQMPVFRDYLFRQKSEANISLARNLGHDLTNVIATSKFDILAIQTWLRRRRAKMEEENTQLDEREAVLADSVQGLLNTTKFMQEIVNIYRAFSYMDEPRWERTDLNALVTHLCDLFRLTLSRRVEVVTELTEGLPETLCEPRLIQLALFNLMTNANQAIKRQGENAEGIITVSTRPGPDPANVEITVRDSGPGIRDQDGELLTGDALFQVFFLGITTRREGEEKGEGLGLNWVWAIIHDFHGGAVQPENHPEGGAAFRLRLPIAGKPDAPTPESDPHEGTPAPQETPHG